MRQFTPILFLIIILGIFAAANIYLSRRLNLLFSIENTRILYYVFAGLILFMIFGMMPLSNTVNGFGSLVYKASAITMGFLLFLLLSLILVDLTSLFINIPLRWRGIITLLLPVFISVFGILNAMNTKVHQVEVGLKGLNSEVTAVQLSDIHIGHFWGIRTLEKIVTLTNRQHPDVVFITGDLFDGRIRLSEENLQPLTRLKAPVYFVEGNHDGYTGHREIKDKLRKIGVTVLENQITGFGELQIVGLNHMRADSTAYNMHAAHNGQTIQSVLDSLKPDPGKPTILLHHSPDGIKYASRHNIDLYLAGHTHAGQLFPVKYIANAIFDYNKGLHQYENTRIYVSQGSGTFGPPMRIGTNSEITLLKLKPEK